ncbi:MAG: hypothetical protein NTZ14_09175 [Hyphomicrobiales bacterium]|nr:hypothetical protein [Hyphomicrobiales bacterium]
MIPAFKVARAVLVVAWRAACASGAAPVPTLAVLHGPRPVTAWLAGAAVSALDEGDRERAFAAQIAAAEIGRRASWRSTKGHFGFVEPGPERVTSSGPCRSFENTVYSDGRAQRGGGNACRGAAGTWDVVG